jgi:K+-transporting ATPase ATPase C chain
MLREIRPAFVFIVALTVITGVVYPFVVTGIARVAFPYQAQGSLLERDGKVIGSALIGQQFTSDRYFHGRPSATVAPDPNDATKTVPVPYNAANSGGSNLGPTNKALIERVQADLEKLKQENSSAQVAPDLVTTSGSGLDPDISPAGRIQGAMA